MQIKITRACYLANGELVKPGDVRDVPGGIAAELVTASKAEYVREAKKEDEQKETMTTESAAALVRGRR
jgi:hypothetical protein